MQRSQYKQAARHLHLHEYGPCISSGMCCWGLSQVSAYVKSPASITRDGWLAIRCCSITLVLCVCPGSAAVFANRQQEHYDKQQQQQELECRTALQCKQLQQQLLNCTVVR
jgi:hypothetical protein